MSNCMEFSDTVEEFMEQYKIVDTEHIYSNGTEYVPIFRMKQWFEHLSSAEPKEVIPHRNYKYFSDYWCECGWHLGKKGDVKYCAECGRKVKWDG